MNQVLPILAHEIIVGLHAEVIQLVPVIYCQLCDPLDDENPDRRFHVLRAIEMFLSGVVLSIFSVLSGCVLRLHVGCCLRTG